MTALPAPAPTAAGSLAAQVVNEAASALYRDVRAMGRAGGDSVADWMGVLADCAAARARIDAAQTLALAHVAAIDTVDAGTDDGSWVEQHRGLGHVRFDAPELVAPTLGLTPSAAEAKVRQAVALVTRTPAVITAMASGHGDAYRAGIIAEELAEAPGAEARAVVAALVDRFGREPGGRLRARVRRELNKINPELVRHQCLKARSNTGLRRWVNGDGTDTWQVEAPTETSRAAYAAVNDLALQVKKTTGVNIAAARATAMFQLILGHATGSYQVHVGIPLSILAGAAATVDDTNRDDSDLVEVTGMDASGPTFVPRAWLADLLNGTLDHALHPEPEAGDVPVAADRVDEHQQGPSDQPDPSGEPDPSADAEPLGEAAVIPGTSGATNAGTAPTVEQPTAPPARVDGVGCHDGTGSYATGRLDPMAKGRQPGWLTDKYHPTRAIRAAVIARDGHCRFPGCSASARLCDLDHVIAWPTGTTTPANLILLCRRHHRVKQRRGWSVRLHPDGTVAWTNPLGDRLVTEPFNHLTAPSPVRLAESANGRGPGGGSGPPPAEPTSRLEQMLIDRSDTFDWEVDRFDEVIIGATGAARHARTMLGGSAIDVDTVLFTDCPIRWEFTGTWGDGSDDTPEASDSPASLEGPTPRRVDQPGLDVSKGRGADGLGGHQPHGKATPWTSWSEDTCAEGDEPPF